MKDAHKVDIAVFAYNFPHKKTQDFLFWLKVLGFNVRLVIAADPVKLKIPPATVRTKIRHKALLHPRDVTTNLGWEYRVAAHNSQETRTLLEEHKIELGVIAGARILKAHIIESVPLGIINFHPGLIPEARGLDAVLWSIYKDISLGVTAHIIDEKIDAGKILIKRSIPIYQDDTIYDLTERVYELQLDLLEEAIHKAVQGEGRPIEGDGGFYNRKMPPHLEQETMQMVKDYVRRHAEREDRRL